MKKIFALTLVILVGLSSAKASAMSCADPQKYVESLSNEVVGVIQGSTSDSAKQSKLTSIFKSQVNTNWMGKFVLGRNWKSLTPEQQKTYLGKYSEYLVASYVPTFRKYSGEKINVQSVKALENGESEVKTTIERPEKGDVIVNYRVRKEGSCYKVSDIVAEGISLINTQRQDFDAVFSQSGYDGLIESLDRKISAAASPASGNAAVASQAKKVSKNNLGAKAQ